MMSSAKENDREKNTKKKIFKTKFVDKIRVWKTKWNCQENERFAEFRNDTEDEPHNLCHLAWFSVTWKKERKIRRSCFFLARFTYCARRKKSERIEAQAVGVRRFVSLLLDYELLRVFHSLFDFMFYIFFALFSSFSFLVHFRSFFVAVDVFVIDHSHLSSLFSRRRFAFRCCFVLSSVLEQNVFTMSWKLRVVCIFKPILNLNVLFVRSFVFFFIFFTCHWCSE